MQLHLVGNMQDAQDVISKHNLNSDVNSNQCQVPLGTNDCDICYSGWDIFYDGVSNVCYRKLLSFITK